MCNNEVEAFLGDGDKPRVRQQLTLPWMSGLQMHLSHYMMGPEASQVADESFYNQKQDATLSQGGPRDAPYV